MHHIYHTEAFVLSSRNSREADKVFTIFTKELGLVRASATSVRKISSKLRYALQDFSLARIDLVRGRETWRIISATPIKSISLIGRTYENSQETFLRKDLRMQIIANIFSLIKRLSHGEEANEFLYEDLKRGIEMISAPTLLERELESVESVVVLRILYHLGYFSHKPELSVLVKGEISENLLTIASTKRTKIVTEINQALRESQL